MEILEHKTRSVDFQSAFGQRPKFEADNLTKRTSMQVIRRNRTTVFCPQFQVGY